MQIKVLVENTKINPAYKSKHGLSLYIETENNKILFDLGPTNVFSYNALKLGVDIAKIDTVVISHGHIDHGGGLKTFLSQNKLASIYIHKLGFEQYYTNIFGFKYYVGLDNSLKNDNRIIFTKDGYCINEELQLFSNIKETSFVTKSNKKLFIRFEGKYSYDSFDHEQNLIVRDNDKYVLFAGCAHKGIINILNKAELICGREVDYVVGGFHLFNPTSRKVEETALIEDIAEKLKKKKTQYYTCHCTGQKPYRMMKAILGDQIKYLQTGSTVEF